MVPPRLGAAPGLLAMAALLALLPGAAADSLEGQARCSALDPPTRLPASCTATAMRLRQQVSP